jgi:hypothetical protein
MASGKGSTSGSGMGGASGISILVLSGSWLKDKSRSVIGPISACPSTDPVAQPEMM